MKKIVVFTISFVFSIVLVFSFYSLYGRIFDSAGEKPKQYPWAEEKIKTMTLEEKIAQLLMVRIHSNYDQKTLDQILATVEKYQLGGVCFFKGGPARQINLTNRLQKTSKIPLLISIDGEWGPSMRLDSCIMFPRQMAMGAMDHSGDQLIYEMGKKVAMQCKALGIHINFAPSVDVNNNADNPVINSRSFGEDRELVAQKGISYMRGMQENGLTACAKHFPGHGDTGTDSHHDLPVINKTRAELDSLEFYPFRKMIDAGVEMVMVSHLNIPALDKENNSISTLSYNTITGILKNEMGFKGIVITDAMDMSGLRKSYPSGADAEIKALQAGIDILLLPNDVSIVIPALVKAVQNGELTEEMIDEKCLKVLKLKEEKGLTQFSPIPVKGIYQKLNEEKTKELVKQISAKSITLLKNEKNILPLQAGDEKTVLLCIGGLQDADFLKKQALKYGIGFVQTDRSISGNAITELQNKLAPYSHVVVAVLSTSQTLKYKYGIYKESVDFIQRIAKNKEMTVAVFGNPYATMYFGDLKNIPGFIIAYQPTLPAIETTLEAIFGNAPFEGKLPVSIKGFKAGEGIKLAAASFDIPDSFSSLPEKNSRTIDSLIQNGIENKILPGCQLLAMQNGKVIFHKNYGFHTYEKDIPVSSSTLYDIASITKPVATTLAVMRLYEEKKLKLNDKIKQYLPDLTETDKGNLTIAELLTHTSGLPSYIPFYKEIAIEEKRADYLSNTKTADYNIEVAKDVYLHRTYLDTIKYRIASCTLKPKKYIYSDLGFILLKEIIENIAEKPLDVYVQEEFYKPMGLTKTCYKPLTHGISLNEIAPTERDTFFRKQVVHGYIHDQTTALLGGVSGNAGVFSNANELAIIFQMLMRNGIFNGERYFKKSTVELFTTTYPLNGGIRRGLGFDTPGGDKNTKITPPQASQKTYGHQGFTGTVFWIDPETKLVYIFLSNRVYPDTDPNKLSESKIRLLVHEEIYKAIGK